MTPFQITIALHYIFATTDFNNGDFSAPVVQNTINQLTAGGLLVPNTSGTKATLMATAGLQMYATILSAIKLPSRVWQM